MDCLTVDEMEKYMVYDSGADCREFVFIFFSFFFLTIICIIVLQLSSLNTVHPLLAFFPF